MNDKVREKLSDPKLAETVRKFSEGVDEFIGNLEHKEYKEGWPEDKWEEELPKHPYFATELNYGDELPPLVEAMQKLKYDPEYCTPLEIAQAYKEDGNEQFKKEKYQLAEVAYTEGLNAKCEDQKLNAVLYTNRAAAHYHMGHYRKALKDATAAKELNPLYAKAYYRGAACYLKLEKYDDSVLWCNEGLKLKAKDKALLDLKEKAQRQIERKEQLKAEAEKKRLEIKRLNKAIRDRGINLEKKGLTEESIICDYPGASAQVHLTADGALNWPVIFLYPQYCSSDLIQAFHEDICFFENFMNLFEEPADWDVKKEYSAENLKVYFSDIDGNLVPVDEMLSLKSVMVNKRFKVTSGTLKFIVTSCQYDEIYRAQNNVVEF